MTSAGPGTAPVGLAWRSVVVLGAVLTVLTLGLCSVRFARLDWTGLPLDRGPARVEVTVGHCDEVIEAYETRSGRTIEPVVVDEEQYLSMVRVYGGDPPSATAATCFYTPFVHRVAVPWLAHLLGGDEAVAVALVNTAFMVGSLWVILALLRRTPCTPRALVAVAALTALNWNTLMFGSGILVEAPVLFVASLFWLLLSARRPWAAALTVAVGMLFKEYAVVLLPVMWAWSLSSPDRGRGARFRAWAPSVAATVGVVVGATLARAAAVDADAPWPGNLDPVDLARNLLDPVGLVALVLAAGPVFLPALGEVRHRWRTRGEDGSPGWRVPADPAVVGLAMSLLLTAYGAASADLSPRMLWAGFPFAADLGARWWSRGRAAELLSRLPPRPAPDPVRSPKVAPGG